MTTSGTRRVHVRIDGRTMVTTFPVEVAAGLAGFAVPLPPDARVIDVVREGDSRPLAQSAPVIPRGDTPGVVVGISADRVITAYYDEFGQICVDVRRGPIERRQPACFGDSASTPEREAAWTVDAVGIAPPWARWVRILEPNGRLIARVPTFGCEAGFPVCFFYAMVERSVPYVLIEPG